MIRAATVAACLLATPALAQDFEVMGTVRANIDGKEAELWVPYIVDEDEAYATLSGFGVVSTLNVDSFGGEPGESIGGLRVIINVMQPGPEARPSDLEIYGATGPQSVHLARDGVGAFSVSGMTVDGTTIAFDFSATAEAVDRSAFLPIEDADPVTIEGSATVDLREE